MASNGKKKTTFAKLNREQKVRDRRVEKQARKDARKLAAANGETPDAGAPAAEELPTDAGVSRQLSESPR
jgi:hypothetical protein